MYAACLNSIITQHRRYLYFINMNCYLKLGKIRAFVFKFCPNDELRDFGFDESLKHFTIFAEDSFVSRRTRAREVVDKIWTSSIIHAGVTATFIDVCSTPKSSISSDAGAAEGIIKVITGSTVLTRVAFTFICVYLSKKPNTQSKELLESYQVKIYKQVNFIW